MPLGIFHFLSHYSNISDISNGQHITEFQGIFFLNILLQNKHESQNCAAHVHLITPK